MLIECLSDLVQPAIAAPFRCERVGDELVLISRHVEGLHLGELLVRRGRFPPSVVWEIARQLVDGLHALEQRGVPHGDIRAANVRLTKTGTAVLVDTGIRAAVDPELSVHSGLPPGHYDGVAPELIGTVASPTVSSDMYALGCLLYQLLAGRPPFPGGDPLVKLAAHQTRTIDDVRQWAPETPQSLAEGIRRLTSRNPADRPAGFAEVLEQWGVPNWRGRRRLAAFRRWFDAPAPMRVEPSSRSHSPRWRALAGMLLVALLIAGALQNDGARTVLVSWRASFSSDAAVNTSDDASDQAVRPDRTEVPNTELIAAELTAELMALPNPDQHGVVRLKERGPYLAREITTVGVLTIVAEGPTPSEIVIRDEPLQLTAEAVRIENVQMRHEAETSARGKPRPALVLVQAQKLQLERCVLLISELSTTSARPVGTHPSAAGIGLGWKLVDIRDPQGGVLALRNTVLVGGDCAIEINDPVRRIEFVNCLRMTGGALGQFTVPIGARSETVVRLDRTTCRGGMALFRLAPPDGGPSRGRMSIEANDCVLDLVTHDGCLFELTSEGDSEATPQIKLTGEGSLAPSTLITATRRNATDFARFPLDISEIPVEGILAGPYRFAGTLSLDPSDAAIRDYDAPRRSPVSPGVDPAQLPTLLR